ncbi:hypothetical protein [Algoriphagus taiwanensis]|uniref:Lipocalin-like domain-containing protein n=1 Tax=Algoriphagus taiwanensis TaxID=1445656 RepID=A0ABQ6PZR6_9BACT|nr:hypothetical protein Ataiwa_16910 [Algoriphagus taiwanensis]
MLRIFILILLIDPSILLGRWNLKFAEANFNMINSSAFQATPKEQQDEILEVNELYLKNAYLEFKKDTVFWVDVNPREKRIVNKRGKWMVIGDTLRIFDYDKIYTYNYLIEESDEYELHTRFIFPNGDLARSRDVYSKVDLDN